MENKIEQFKQLVEESNNTVFFGGAGVSTYNTYQTSRNGRKGQIKNGGNTKYRWVTSKGRF